MVEMLGNLIIVVKTALQSKYTMVNFRIALGAHILKFNRVHYDS